MPKQVWTDDNYVKAYILARSVTTKERIAKGLGVTKLTLMRWMKAKPALRKAIAMGRGQEGSAKTLSDWVYARLPPEVQVIWNRINKYEKVKNGVARIEAMLENTGKQARQQLFLHAYIVGGFNVSEACRKTNTCRKVWEQWYKTDPDFHTIMDEMLEHKKNFMEGALMDLIAMRDTSAVIFANKTFNADRGYAPKMQLDVKGEINHTHKVLQVSKLQLPPEVKRVLAKAIQQYEKENSNGTVNGHATESILHQFK
jgi:hypothetical protein